MNSLSAKLAFLYALIALTIALIQTALNTLIEYKRANQTLKLEIEQTFTSITSPAAQAVFDVSNVSAQKLLDGMKPYGYWQKCTLYDELNQSMAQIKNAHPTFISPTSWMTELLVEEPLASYAQNLHYADDRRPMGRIECILNHDLALQSFYERSNEQIMGTIIRTFIVFIIVFYFTHRLITKPLIKIALKLKSLKSGHEHNEIQVSRAYIQTELGVVIDSFNSVIKERDLAQRELLILNKELEEKVKERTSALESANEKLKLLATTDPLTGVNNRRSFFEQAEQKFKAFKRYKRPQVIMMIDIDYFKQINDKWGHGIGDEAIKCCTNTCLECIRETDLLGRLGGEEFAILLPETELTDAKLIAERIRSSVTINASNIDANLKMTVSIGIFQLGETIKTFHGALEKADLALYEAKNKGRNRVEVN